MRVFLCLFVFLAFSCSDSDPDFTDTCIPVVFEINKFNSAPNYGANLTELSIDGSCLTVKLGVSGCDDDHELEMVSDGAFAKSFPPQVTFDFYAPNPQLCEAYFLIEKQYDLSPLDEFGEEDIIINFRNNDNSITYSQ
jgi:hypothetical protein